MTESEGSRLPLIDADAHVIETEHTWDYLEPEYEKYRPQLFTSSTETPRRDFWVINGRIGGLRTATMSEKDLENHARKTGRLVRSSPQAREMDDVKLRLRGMDELGIDVQILHNTLWIESLTDLPEIEGALCHSWNHWMADIFDQGEGRLFWTCVVPSFDIDRAIEQMQYSRDHGAVAVCLRPYEGDLIVTDRYFYPLLEEAVRLDMPVAVHIANGSPTLHRLLATRDPSMAGWARFSVPTVIAAMSVMMTHVTADFPTLRWGMIEASASWVPWLCYELRRRTGAEFTPESNPFLDHNIYVTAVADDDLPYILRTVGEKVLMIGTDFGHTDTASEYDALAQLRTTSEISESARWNLLSNNPSKFYALGDRARPVDSLVGI